MTFVVALAAICDSKLLCAQRSYPEKLRGKWELPGGKVRDGEKVVAALVREIKEELDWEIPPSQLKQILPGPLPAGNWSLPKGAQMRVMIYRPRELPALQAGDSHLSLQWSSVEKVTQLDWLEPDLPIAEALSRALKNPAQLRPQNR
ncbi:MAG: NUDIX domain-containing protein [Varibaculum cambriense]|uniref:NUDIX domain-containing protein n=1 Tax=Varibaculum cambriense TaxID=184870 RepID=UPI001EC5B611|nr:NUDIX domain-containing protein [Varibaculum cambriense]MBS5919532.1 NUDIX domain-containing protein [Varibaculum cambriense]